MAHRQSTSRHKRFAEFANDTIVPALNHPDASGPVARFVRLLIRANHLNENLNYLAEKPDAKRLATFGWPVPMRVKHNRAQWRELDVKLHGVLAEASTILGSHQWKASVLCWSDDPQVSAARRLIPVPELLSAAPGRTDEAYALEMLLVAVSDDPAMVMRFQTCKQCAAWFFAVTTKQKFCTRRCWKAFERSKPEKRAAHTTYMREKYRPRKKEKMRMEKQRRATETARKRAAIDARKLALRARTLY